MRLLREAVVKLGVRVVQELQAPRQPPQEMAKVFKVHDYLSKVPGLMN